MVCYHQFLNYLPNFIVAVQFVLDNEGGLSNNPDDPGGITKFGITLGFLKDKNIKLSNNPISDSDIRNMTLDQAKAIYYKYFWAKYHYDAINDLEIATKLFDFAVNMGESTAHKLLQIAINHFNDKPIAVDGIIGSQTIAAANALINDGHELDLLHQLKVNAVHHYINLVADNPKLKEFEAGWIARANK